MSKLSATDISRIKSNISSVLALHARMSAATAHSLLPVNPSSMEGKLYEAHVLAHVIEQLVKIEQCMVRFAPGSRPMFRQKGGNIDLKYPHFDVVAKSGKPMGKLLTDVYFHTLSHQNKASRSSTRGDYHELDIVLVKSGVTAGKPSTDDILLAIECKNRPLHKHIIRELLGFRRELSYVVTTGKSPTGFSNWPARDIGANPPSVHMLFTTHPRIADYEDNCDYFGILLRSYKMS